MMDYKPALTPIETQHFLIHTVVDYRFDKQFHTRHWFVVMSLMYTMLSTRPNFMFAIPVINQYFSKPNNSYWKAVKQIFLYIKGTLDVEFTFWDPLMALMRYTNVDWAGDQDIRRMTSSFVFNLRSGAISWFSQYQPTFILSIY